MTPKTLLPTRRPLHRTLVAAFVLLGAACESGQTAGSAKGDTASADVPAQPVDDVSEAGDVPAAGDTQSATADTGQDAPPPCGTRAACAAAAEEKAEVRLQEVLDDPDALDAFLRAVPKGADLHNHLTGAVYAENYLDWAREDGNCVDPETYGLLFGNKCTDETEPIPESGPFFDAIIRAWSMQDFVPGEESGHDHFFATFAKFGLVAGGHRNESIADVLNRAAEENALRVETMFNLAKNVGAVGASVWSGPLAAEDLPAFYDAILTDPDFEAALDDDVSVVESAASGYRKPLGCDDIATPPACEVGLGFLAQVARTGPADTVFGQLVGAFEMAVRTPWIVGANLSSPEDDPSSLERYDIHMAMLDFLHGKYTATGVSPLRIALHAGELTQEYLPAGHTLGAAAHIRKAVELGHARRIGHGLDVFSEPDPEGLMATMKERSVLVEICLSSNIQILEVSGEAHPLRGYMSRGVPVALATDDQGISRSSMAGEYRRGVLDQELGYRELKRMARDSLEHAFVEGASLWWSVAEALPVGDCTPTEATLLGDPPVGACAAFLEANDKARLQWELERRFLEFEGGL